MSSVTGCHVLIAMSSTNPNARVMHMILGDHEVWKTVEELRGTGYVWNEPSRDYDDILIFHPNGTITPAGTATISPEGDYGGGDWCGKVDEGEADTQ